MLYLLLPLKTSDSFDHSGVMKLLRVVLPSILIVTLVCTTTLKILEHIILVFVSLACFRSGAMYPPGHFILLLIIEC